jgi:pyrroline-5-carboxylate reductase
MELIKKIFMVVILSFLIIILFHYGFNMLTDIFSTNKTKDILKLSKEQYDSFKKTLKETVNETKDENIISSQPVDMENVLKNYIQDLKTK